MKISLLIVCLIGSLSLAVVAEPLRVLVSIPPYQEWVSAIGQENVVVSTLLPANVSPEVTDIRPSMIRQLTHADMIVLNGSLPVEQAIIRVLVDRKISVPILLLGKRMQIRGKKSMQIHGMSNLRVQVGNHHPNHHHHHQDPHHWLALSHVMKQVRFIGEVLEKELPANAETLVSNKTHYLSHLKSMDQSFRDRLAPYQDRYILTYHGSLGRFAEDYGLHQLSIESDGKEPTIRQLRTLITTAKKNKIKTVYTQNQFKSETAIVVAKRLRGALVPFSPLRSDYSQMMNDIIQMIIDGFE
ncbi:zinc ABC transporter solute-binding protein [bacterium]|jgi:zinc transport system substrate-binding protein|nr:zinc ABC transporter solute-binding protein [bacterium]